MQTQDTPTPRDNLLGVCHGIGGAFGFDPLILRIAVAIGMLINFEMTILAYAALGVAVLAATLIARWSSRSARLSASA